MVSHNSELCAIQVATPKLKSMYHCKELLLTHMTILLSWLHAFTLTGNGSAILQQDNTQANPAGIADDFKGLV